MTKTPIILAVLSCVLLVSGCATRCDEFCKITYATREVLK